HIFHLETLPGLRDLVRVAGAPPALVVLNSLHPQATRQAEEAKSLIEDVFKFPVCPVHLCRREVHADAQTTGSTPLDTEPDGKAAQELRPLYQFIIQQTNKSDSSHVENAKLAAGA